MEKFIIDLLNQKPDRKMTYHEFISTVLYTPKLGYYMGDREKIGKQGDFYTTSNLSDVFGRTLAKWILHIITESGLPPVLCEIGGGTGRLADSILTYIKNHEPDMFDRLQYFIIDISPFQREKQKETLSAFKDIHYIDALEDLPVIEGIIFSNELFDALPVHVVEKKHGLLFEVMITEKAGQLVEVLEPLEKQEILRYLQEQDVSLVEGQRFEVPLEMVAYLQSIAGHLQKGFLVSIDYGYTNEEWKEPVHRKGSLRGYHKHQMVENVLSYPGKMDMTTHIHFDALIKFGAVFGLKHEALIGQQEFLLRAGILNELQAHDDPNPFSETAKRNRAIRNLIVPGGISSYFRVLLQSKGLPADQTLFPEEKENP
ncbi:class I SAM-dependent methyltransferase [Bacillus sp. V59.32b]|uniref:class I SAM-dependent methyltransferase n=1 Tax=Bacillus sp. V59.32b TaxID=1758642 RepID=UPI0020B125D9|nr:SAM-dependent methyltransferase [Bacillus sp. V59.32b]